MLELLFTLPLLPLASFVVLALLGDRLPARYIAGLGVGSVGLAALVAVPMAIRYLVAPPPGDVFVQRLWTWLDVGGLTVGVTLYLDPLALVMVLVVTVVGFLIHLYAAELMADDDGYCRFFAYMNLFVAAMLILVLADSLPLLYLGWEGVGLCSFLLIGFWYRDPATVRAARKAFVVTRIGDTALAIGLFLLFAELGTLDLQAILARAGEHWMVGATGAVVAAALVLGGAVGKSAQLPLQTWLPDAMAGPTPVSALIHAATMVTAGVYLIARLNGLFLLAPAVLTVIAWLGAATLLIAAHAALTQRDIKRVLAYSTISQLGYMFLALGVGAFSAAIFHLMTHAFFKALLFLGAGVITMALHHQHDIFKMGGLRHQLRVPFLMFLAAGASLAGFPLVTAGFYSKDSLLYAVWSSERGSFWLWAAGLLGAFVTSLYIFRLIFVVFFGEVTTPVDREPRLPIKIALGALTILSLIGGFVELPATLGNLPLFTRLLERTLPATVAHGGLGAEGVLEAVAGLASLAGIFLAYQWFVRHRPPVAELHRIPGLAPAVERWWLAGFGFDRLYDRVIVRPFLWLTGASAGELVDHAYHGLARAVTAGHRLARTSQTGHLRWYAAGLAAGAALVIALVVLP